MNKKDKNNLRIGITSMIVFSSLAAVIWFAATSEPSPNAVPSYFDGDFRRLINKEQKKAIARQRKSLWVNDAKEQRILVTFGRTIYYKEYGVCRIYFTETLYNGKSDRWQGTSCKNKLGKWFRL